MKLPFFSIFNFYYWYIPVITQSFCNILIEIKKHRININTLLKYFLKYNSCIIRKKKEYKFETFSGKVLGFQDTEYGWKLRCKISNSVRGFSANPRTVLQVE